MRIKLDLLHSHGFKLLAIILFSIANLLIANLKVLAEEATQAERIAGFWFNDAKSCIIEIYVTDNKFFGKIAWLEEPLNEQGEVKKDTNNPDKSQQGNTVLGLILLKDFVYKNKNKWSDGTIYDPQNGKTYSCKLTLDKEGNLQVRGYIGISLIGRTTVWTKAAEQELTARRV